MTPATASDWLSLSDTAKGRAAERVVQHVLINSYIMHTPLFLIDDRGAPKMRGIHDVVLPDIQMHMRRRNVYIDVKCKSRSVMYHVLREERHGIDRDVFFEYQRSAWFARSDAGIAIVELCRVNDDPVSWSGAVLMASFATLKTPREGHGTTRGQMVYWPRSLFTEVCRFSPGELAEAVHGNLPVGFTRRREIERVFQLAMDAQGLLF